MVHRVTVFFDYHCPFCFRAERWLAGLGGERVAVRHRFLSLEQLNRDPEAAEWRIWEQPLDYEHYRGRGDRRSLAAFLATAIAEREGASAVAERESGSAIAEREGGSAVTAEVIERLRLAIFAARHEARLDISRIEVLDEIAAGAGLPAGWLTARFADPEAVAAARARIAADWAAAREPFRCFGVPTLVVDEAPPVYLRLERVPTADEAPRLLDWLVERARSLPFVLEVKQPPRADEGS